jgi:hypothetical protein
LVDTVTLKGSLESLTRSKVCDTMFTGLGRAQQ